MKKGITLIALVVTIIILLLLAAVTISLVMGPDGIIEKARETKVAGRYSSIMDKVSAREADLEIASRTGGAREHQEDFINRLITEGLITSDDEYDDDYMTIYLGRQSDGTYKYTINVADERTEAEKIAEAINSLPDANAPGNEHLKNMTLIIQTTYSNRTPTLPISNANGLKINWGTTDNIFELPNRTTDPYYTYPQGNNTYEVQIQGKAIEGAIFGGRSYMYSNSYIVGIKHWGENGFSVFNSFGKNLQGEIPLPSRNSFKNATSFYKTFESCYNLTGSIPAGLFANCPNVTSFNYTFDSCYSITGNIPARLFANCPKVTSFGDTFSYCNSLTGSIPARLFANCPNVEDFSGTFFNCSSLTGNIPTGLFNNCQKVTYFSTTFYGCYNLTGVAPSLWKRIPEPNGNGCFFNCLNLTNYNIIPAHWKGPVGF